MDFCMAESENTHLERKRPKSKRHFPYLRDGCCLCRRPDNRHSLIEAAICYERPEKRVSVFCRAAVALPIIVLRPVAPWFASAIVDFPDVVMFPPCHSGVSTGQHMYNGGNPVSRLVRTQKNRWSSIRSAGMPQEQGKRPPPVFHCAV